MRLRPVILAMASAVTAVTAAPVERQLTTAAQGHVLTNVNVWSPDGAWIVYDVRTGDAFNGEFIEQVNVRTGAVQRLYTAKNGARVGVVTYNPAAPRVVFIHGPENPTADWTYHFTRRRGAYVDVAAPGVARPLDAMNYAPPFAPGALRGGSHVHVFSPDGQWVSFTYEDAVLAALDAASGVPPHAPNQRNIGVSVPAGPVRVAPSHPRNHDGDFFSVIVTRTVAAPRPGSDDIAKAFEEGWIGRDGYVRADGSRQRRALAFLGLVTAADGRAHAEVYVADLPDDLTQAGAAPLGGTPTAYPAPPHGATQRRLTFTAGRKFPGVVALPRHWLRVSPDGAQIAFLMKDDAGVVQFFTVSPNGGEPRQVTRNAQDIASAFTWSPDGRSLAHVLDGSVCVTDVATGRTERLTPRREGGAAPSALACVFSPDGRAIAYTREVAGPGGTFPQVFIVTLP
jgi:hypothetical protein